MKALLALILVLTINIAKGQHYELSNYKFPDATKNISVKPLYHDSLCSGFLIFIKEKVKMHKHLEHSEQVIILEGEGQMTLGDSTFVVKAHDVIYIPKGTVHGLHVTSNKPMKVHSTQSPHFDGSDRVFVE